MAMFGSQPIGLSGQPDWLKMIGMMPQGQSPTQPQAMPQQPMAQPTPQNAGGMMARKKPGFGDPGGWGERLGAIGSVLLDAAGVRNDGYEQYMLLKRQRAEDQRKALLAETAKYAPQDVGGSLVRLNPQTGKYEAVYTPDPKPVNNDTVNDYQFIASTLGKDAADGYLRNMAAGPPMAVENPDGTRTIYPRGAFGSAPMASGPAPGTIKNGYRFKGGNPKDQNSWEPIGGATPSASGGFRR